ncbi:hypothetical protein CI238_03540, partial [Colletotrichum incanum]
AHLDYSWSTPLLEQPIDAERKVRHIRDTEYQIYVTTRLWMILAESGITMGTLALPVTFHNMATSFPSARTLASGAEIHVYQKKVVDHYQLQTFIKLKHRVIGTTWSRKTGKWAVRSRNLETGTEIVDDAYLFLYTTGLLSKPQVAFH